MLYRTIIVCFIFLASAAFLHAFDMDAQTPIKKPLAQFPERIGNWKSGKSQPLQEDVARVLGVDDYVFRNYFGPNGETISFYASYFAYTDRTKGYHSPLNCMPGSGWNIAGTKPVELQLQHRGRETVNRIVLQNGAEKQVALYWYQCRGRIIQNEYWERIYRVIDSLWRQRTDGAFVRLILHQRPDEANESRLKQFAAAVIPILSNHLPE